MFVQDGFLLKSQLLHSATLTRRPWKLLPVLVLIAAVLTACGDSSQSPEGLPPMPPTATPVPPTPVPQSEPEPEPEGEVLEPLEDGQEIVADDQRYSLMLPDFWIQGTAASADIAYRESGGTPADNEYAYNVMREQLPAGVQDVHDYAEAGRQAAEETLDDLETVSMEPVQIGDIQGVRWIYTARLTADTVMVHQVYIVDGDMGFLLTGSAPADGDLDAARDLFDSIAGSFEFPRG